MKFAAACLLALASFENLWAIELFSERGNDCTLVNPWPGQPVVVHREGRPAEIVSGERFTLNTFPDGWRTLDYDLSNHFGNLVNILVEVSAGGNCPWNSERAFFDEFSVIGE